MAFVLNYELYPSKGLFFIGRCGVKKLREFFDLSYL